jgi:hypothetical protein
MQIRRIALAIVPPMTLLLFGLFSMSVFAKEVKSIAPDETIHYQITHTVYLPAIRQDPPKDLIVIKSPYENRPEYSDYVTYFGEFLNNTDEPIWWVEVYFAFYDSEGLVIGIEDTTNSRIGFSPGHRICWKMWVRKSWGEPVLHHKEYDVIQFSDTPQDVRIQNTRLITDESDFKVIGELFNGGPYPIKNMRNSVTLYNPQVQVVGCDPYVYPIPDPLPVGQVAIFEADSFYDADRENAVGYSIYGNYQLDITSLSTSDERPVVAAYSDCRKR